MYTVRLRLQGKHQGPVEMVTDRFNLTQLLNILENSRNVVAFQVWQAGIGQCKQGDFSFGGFTKMTDEGLW